MIKRNGSSTVLSLLGTDKLENTFGSGNGCQLSMRQTVVKITRNILKSFYVLRGFLYLTNIFTVI